MPSWWNCHRNPRNTGFRASRLVNSWRCWYSGSPGEGMGAPCPSPHALPCVPLPSWCTSASCKCFPQFCEPLLNPRRGSREPWFSASLLEVQVTTWDLQLVSVVQVMWDWTFNQWHLMLTSDRMSELKWIAWHPASVAGLRDVGKTHTGDWCQKQSGGQQQCEPGGKLTEVCFPTYTYSQKKKKGTSPLIMLNHPI